MLGSVNECSEKTHCAIVPFLEDQIQQILIISLIIFLTISSTSPEPLFETFLPKQLKLITKLCCPFFDLNKVFF